MSSERRSKDKLAIDPELVRELARLLDETGLTEIEFERDGQRVRVAREAHRTPAAAAARPAVSIEPTAQPLDAGTTDPAKHPGVVTSPMVGTAYRGAEPGARPF